MTDDLFTNNYIRLRKKEGRIYSDAEVLQLPEISSSHQHYNEWQIRNRSCKKLLHYIKKKNADADILEVGCGNGWLSAQIANVTDGKVLGIDINHIELEQAKKLFGQKFNLEFLHGDINTLAAKNRTFDLIVFAASIQYFESLKNIIALSLNHLNLQGEIHIIDSKFYPIHEAMLAQERSQQYYTLLGFPEMKQHYFHHTLEELKAFNYKIMYNPSAWSNKILFRKNPFHWIVIKNRFD